jgi:hypothetical protein
MDPATKKDNVLAFRSTEDRRQGRRGQEGRNSDDFKKRSFRAAAF